MSKTVELFFYCFIMGKAFFLKRLGFTHIKQLNLDQNSALDLRRTNLQCVNNNNAKFDYKGMTSV